MNFIKKNVIFFLFIFIIYLFCLLQTFTRIEIASLLRISMPILTTVMVLPYCISADYALSAIGSIPQAIFYSNWYRLPINQQKAILLVLAFSQCKRRFSGWGIINCNLETFVQVFFFFLKKKQIFFFSYKNKKNPL